MCLLIRIISNRRNNVNKKGNDLFLNGRLTQTNDKIEEIQSHLKDNGKSFIFGYHMVINLKLARIALCFQY